MMLSGAQLSKGGIAPHGGQADPNPGTRTVIIGHSDFAGVRFYRPFSDRESQSCSLAVISRAGRIHSIKTLEYLCRMLCRNPGAGVADRKLNLILAFAFNARGNRSASGREFDGVVQNIDHGLPNVEPVGLRADRFITPKSELQIFVVDEHFQKRSRFSHERHEWKNG